MRKLKDSQVIYIANNFFKPFFNIGVKLLTQESVIVAGNDKIFMGGVSNFISTEKPENVVDCLEYKLDFDVFIGTDLFQSSLNNDIENLNKEINDLKEKLKDLESLQVKK